MFVTAYCNRRIATTLYALETWVVPGIRAANSNNNNNNNNNVNFSLLFLGPPSD
jgi:hypothetical protein